MNKECLECCTVFRISDDDEAFLEKISPTIGGQKYHIPPPTHCQECKWKRKMAWRNFNKFYSRISDLTGKQFISIFSQDKPYKVYSLDEWWSDAWDPLSYGRDFDFNRPFFEQFNELYCDVPRPGITVSRSENCDYTNATYSSKDCYLVAGCVENESCYFGHILWYSKDCLDMLYCYYCEGCYECVDCEKCYKLFYGQECKDCSNSYYLYNCRNCKNCFGCAGLVNKEYYIYNQSYSKEEYEKLLPELLKVENQAECRKNFATVKTFVPERARYTTNAENVTGNHIFNSKNSHHSFDIINSEDIRYCFTAGNMKDCYDCIYNGSGLEIGYDTLLSVGYNLLFCRDSVPPASTNLLYCNECSAVNDCFGCVGLHSKEQYCIFNKRYTKEEYEKLVAKIIKHMQRTGEWGEFFPREHSPFAYNETTAHDFYPLSKEEVFSHGWKWMDEKVPTAEKGAPEPRMENIFICEVTGKKFRIIEQEATFYRENNLPFPRKCPDQRHTERMHQRSPRKLWSILCSRCGKQTESHLNNSQAQVIHCEECFVNELR